MLRVVVDNSAGGDPQLADDVATGLREHGFDVELRPAAPGAMFDTAVHSVSAGVVLRLAERPEPPMLEGLEQVVRAALLRRPSLRRRSRAIPVHVGDAPRPIQWIDVFG
jgi:hypothetical protein